MVRGIPASVSAHWPLPNYVDPERNPATVALYIINGIFLSLATIAVVARLYTRIVIRNWFGLDDLCVILAYIPAVGVAACVILGNVRYSWNVHLWDDPIPIISRSIKLLFATKILWSITSSTIRMSLLFFYYRVLDHCQVRQYRWVLHCVMAFVVSVLIIYLTVCIFTCVPVRAYWQWWDTSAQCMNEGVMLLIAAVFNTFSEFVVAVLPIPVVMRLRMDREQKWAIIALLSLGILVSVVGSVRTYYVWLAEIKTFDIPWYGVPQWICAAVEIDVALICACAPALRPLLSRIYDRFSSKVPHKAKAFRADRTTRGKSLTTAQGISKLRTNASEKYRVMYTSHASTVMYQTIDFDDEGFEDDEKGYGHTVSITAPGHHRTRRKRIRKPKGKPEAGVEKEAVEAPAELKQLPCFEILARRSLDIRESWHASVLEGRTSHFWSSGQTPDGSKDLEKDIESSKLRFSEGSREDSSDRRPSSTSTKRTGNDRVQSTTVNSRDETDRKQLVSSCHTAVDAEPMPPAPVVLRGNTPKRQNVLHRRETSHGSWWEYDFGPPTTPQEDRTMWSHAFEKVFANANHRNSWRSSVRS